MFLKSEPEFCVVSILAPAESCTVDCYCPCGWVEEPKDYTKAEIQTKVKEIQEKLTVSKDTLSATVRAVAWH